MVIVFLLPYAEFERKDYQEDAPDFIRYLNVKNQV